MAKNATIIKPVMIQWARERVKLSIDEFAAKMSVSPQRVTEWEKGETAITMNQAKQLAALTLLPLGLFFLNTPPELNLKLPDFRSIGSTLLTDASPELETTILAMQEKQTWYKDFLLENEESPLPFISSITTRTSIKDAAQKIRDVLQFSFDDWGSIKNWSAYMDRLIFLIESAGILFVRNGVVGTNTTRPLDIEEFRGFVLVDNYAPLIFINGRDSKNVQLFTLIHELVHLLLGESGLTDANMFSGSANAIERYCNKVAAEFLAPEEQFTTAFKKNEKLQSEEITAKLSQEFKVSKLVVIARCKELSLLSNQETDRLWSLESAFLKKQKEQKKQGGGDFFASLKYRVGQLFAQTVISKVMDHKLSYSDAYHLLNIKGYQEFTKLSQVVGVVSQ